MDDVHPNYVWQVQVTERAEHHPEWRYMRPLPGTTPSLEASGAWHLVASRHDRLVWQRLLMVIEPSEYERWFRSLPGREDP